ncbi:hypothetical protein HK405_002616 [Cladochytrium tenue]|nr:hypothetical protein HK405_002616 [Cladochytrium tenue]
MASTSATSSVATGTSSQRLHHSQTTSATSAVPAATTVASLDYPRIEAGTVYNWSGIHALANATQLAEPRSISEVIAILLSVARAGKRLRPVGSALSYEPIARTSSSADVLLTLRRLAGPIEFDDSNGTASFLAGTPLEAVFAALVARGRQLPCSPGVIGIQSVAGAIATGTHGQGLGQSTVADDVVALDVVLPPSSSAGAEPQVVRIDRSNPFFGAHMSALGALGVVVAVTFRTVPLRTVTCVKSTVTRAEFESDYVRLNQEHSLVKAWWFPETDQVHLWVADESPPDHVAAYAEHARARRAAGQPPAALNLGRPDDAMNATIAAVADRMARDTKDDGRRTGRQFETVARFSDAHPAVVGTVYDVFCKGIPVPQINCEIAVPLDRFRDAVDALRDWARARPSHSALHYPFIFRSAGQSCAWLNPASRGPVVHIGFLVYLAADGSARPDGLAAMRSLQRCLARRAAGLPHLGKHFSPGVFDLAAGLPRFADFVRLRRQLDPGGLLSNDLLDALFENRLAPSRRVGQAAANQEDDDDDLVEDVQRAAVVGAALVTRRQAHL